MAKRKSLKERMAGVLPASDINFLKNHGEKHTLGFLIQKLGKEGKLIEKELKKLGIQPFTPVFEASNPEPTPKKVSTTKEKVEKIEVIQQPKPIKVKIKAKSSPEPKQKKLKKPFVSSLSESEIEFLKTHGESNPITVLVHQLGKDSRSGRDISLIAREMKHLGLRLYNFREVELKPKKEKVKKVKVIKVKAPKPIKEKKKKGRVAKQFSPEELDYIKENSSKQKVLVISQKLNCSTARVRAAIKQLGLSIYNRKQLSDEEIAFIKKNHKQFFILEMAKKLKRDVSTISKFCKKEGLKTKPVMIHFTESQLNFIKENNGRILRKDIAKQLNCKPHEVQYVVQKYKWYLSPEETKERLRNMIHNHLSPTVVWTPVEEAFILYNFGKMPYEHMAEILKTKSKRQISSYCVAKGMKVTPEMMIQNRIMARKANLLKKQNAVKQSN